MLEPELVRDCIAAMREAVQVPVTIKCRLGVDDADSDALLDRFIEFTSAGGCAVFYIHARKALLKGLTPAQNRMIPPLLERLNRAGVPDRQIACIMALGTHRYMTPEEMQAKVGPAVYRRIRVFNHEWREPQHLIDLGRSAYGTPLQVNRAVTQADVLIGLGAIVPHHIPGYSGASTGRDRTGPGARSSSAA